MKGLLLVLLLALLRAQGAAAQDSPDPALLDTLVTALDATRRVDSLHLESLSLTESGEGGVPASRRCKPIWSVPRTAGMCRVR